VSRDIPAISVNSSSVIGVWLKSNDSNPVRPESRIPETATHRREVSQVFMHDRGYEGRQAPVPAMARMSASPSLCG
jgi:hypothetical protein